MTPERWRQITEIFHAAIAREPARRDAFLTDACGDDRALRGEVESLMAAHQQAGEFGDTPVFVPAPPLEVGTSFGPYRIEGLLGAGGMGEVYRARDPQLGRDVAIKVLPQHLTSDPERLARLAREARLLASLNHPHIGAIYGMEDAGGVRGLVLELVEGPTLADRLARGRLPLADALKIARQIAEALEAAHEKGIIHRDLKPANIAITRDGVVKVLDFGLAKVGEGEASGTDRAESPTMTVNGTRAGLILGTAAYMSPEQARGQTVDMRTDIWAFGCVLYEMLTGRPTFGGDTASDTVARILEREPAWDALPANVPGPIQRLLKRCLRKDPSERLHDIVDARLEIVDALSTPEASEHPITVVTKKGRWLWIAATATAAAITATVLLSLVYRNHPSPVPALLEFPINLPMNADNAGFGLAVSPNGRRVAFAVCCGGPQIWLHSLDSAETRSVPGTEGGQQPFWSPDSLTIGFFSGGTLKRIDVAGGPAIIISDVTGGLSGFNGAGGSWNDDGVILFSAQTGLFRVSATGGPPAGVDVADDAGEGFRGHPVFLADNNHFIYHASGRRRSAIYLASLDSAHTKHVVDSDYPATYAAPNYVMFIRGTALMAQAFNPKTLDVEGPALLVASDVAPGFLRPRPILFASASATGVLTFVKTGGGSPGRLTWFDRAGKPSNSIEQPPGVEYLNPAMSPDGEQVAVNRMDPQTGNWDIWTVDVARDSASRLTFDPARDSDPVWSADGKEIVFVSNRGGQFGLYRRAVGSSGSDELLAYIEGHVIDVIPTDWSRDGRFVLYNLSTAVHPGWIVWALPLFGDRKPVPVVPSEYSPYGARLSPDGKWIAYQSFETGPSEVYVQRFMAAGGKKQISHGGGVHPRWTGDGRELVYWAIPGGVASVELDFNASGVRAGVPKTLIASPILTLIDARPHFDVTRDGQRFLLRQPAGPLKPAITMMINWTEKLKK